MRNLAYGLLLLGLAACGPSVPPALNGYVEAEPVRLSSPVAGRLVMLAVNRGDQVKAGQNLFRLEADNEQAAVDEANARLQQAQAQAEDLASGKRPDELAAIEASLRAARTALAQDERDLQRQRKLAKDGFVAPSSLDAFQSKRDAAAAQVAEAEAQLRAARLAARDQARQAAKAGANAASAQLSQRQWSLNQKLGVAPLAAQVEDSYYRVGEWVPAGSPVLSLLAPAAVKARFWVAEADLPKAQPGSQVTLRCDGCGAPMPATIRFLARNAEYTPPLIYSRDNRAKLVWMAEALPSAADAARLRPGQPLDVTLGSGS